MYFNYSEAELQRRIDLERRNSTSNFKKMNVNLSWDTYSELAELARRNRLQRSQQVEQILQEALNNDATRS